jgi:hypothetical protein
MYWLPKIQNSSVNKSCLYSVGLSSFLVVRFTKIGRGRKVWGSEGLSRVAEAYRRINRENGHFSYIDDCSARGISGKRQLTLEKTYRYLLCAVILRLMASSETMSESHGMTLWSRCCSSHIAALLLLFDSSVIEQSVFGGDLQLKDAAGLARL